MPNRSAQAKTTEASDKNREIEIYIKAAQIIYEKGYAAASMSDIAEAMQMTKAGIYYYIKSKEDLLFAIMTYAMDRLEEEVVTPARAERDPEKRLRMIIRNHGRLLTEGVQAISILSDEVSALTPRHRQKILDRKRAYFDLVRHTLDALKATGKLRAIDSTVATFGLFGMLLWLPRWYVAQGKLSSQKVVDELSKLAIAGLLKD
ncbi:MAG: TetR/AcrR family transcriptional regulator [Pirellulaceae bacterium]|nr:TetR/AcrR family transcriptional regulator [Pirellulaceae bacterium]